MSDRDELAEILEHSDPEGGSHPDEGQPEFSYWYPQADALWAAGWRKKPERDELARLVATMRLAPTDQPDRIDVDMLGGPIADAILALLDGGLSETGEK